MIKEIRESRWVDYLMEFAEENEGKMTQIFVENSVGGRRMLGKNPLIAFEGDCDGDIVNQVKVVIGEEGDRPDNLFHTIKAPQKITVDEDENGVVHEIDIQGGDGVKTIIEIVSD